MRAIRPADHALATVGGWLRRWGWLLGLVLVSIAGALLPISGYIIVVLEGDGPLLPALLAPRMQLDPPFARPGDEVRLHVTDHTPLGLCPLNGQRRSDLSENLEGGLGQAVDLDLLLHPSHRPCGNRLLSQLPHRLSGTGTDEGRRAATSHSPSPSDQTGAGPSPISWVAATTAWIRTRWPQTVR